MGDELTVKILSAWENAGFRKSVSLSSMLGVGQATLHRRIKSMIGSGAVKVIAVPNPVMLGYRAWAKIGIKAESEALNRVTHKLVQHPSVYFVAQAFGTFNIIIATYFSEMNELARFVSSELTLTEGVVNTETMLLACPRKYYRFSWPAPSPIEDEKKVESNIDETASRVSCEVDELSRRILQELMKDGLVPVVRLKSRLNVGQSMIRNRIKGMLKNGIYTLEAVPNPEMLPYEIWATVGITSSQRSADRVIDSIIKYPAVYLAATSLGRFNIIVGTRFRNVDLLSDFLQTRLPGIKGVSSIETFLHVKPIKYHNLIWSRL